MNEYARPVIEELIKIQRTPLIYFGYPAHVAPFILGFRQMASIVGLSVDMDTYMQIVRKRGWDLPDGTDWISWEWLKKRTDREDKLIMDEMLSIEVEAWSKTYE